MRFLDVSAVAVRMDQSVITRDGTRLSADVYLPPGPEKSPVLVTRTPYDNNRAARPREDGGSVGEAPYRRWQRIAANGYVVVAVDVRGRGDSEGYFVPFAHEELDGVDCIQWARSLAECDGRVGVFGAGYAAWCALAASVSTTEVDAVVLQSPFGAPERGLPFQRGVLRLDWLFWMHLVGGRTLQPPATPPWEKVLSHLPLIDMDAALGRSDVWWKEWLVEPHIADRVTSVVERISAISAPTKIMTGWWDQGLAAARDIWDRIESNTKISAAELVVGPWTTRGVRHPVSRWGGIDWGPSALIDSDQEILNWFDEQFSVAPPRRRDVKTFVTGLNEWREQVTWPRSKSRELQFSLSSDNGANTRRGDGQLLVGRRGRAEAIDTFVHNPANPVRWHPHRHDFDAYPEPPLELSTGHITSRDDALVYRSGPQLQPLRLVGRPSLQLSAETDLDDADWIAILADVFPGDVRTLVLAHAATRARLNAQFCRGTVMQYDLEFDDIDHVLLPGHSLELIIVSSLFPLYARNLGSADYLSASEGRIGTHRIFHGGLHQSVLSLSTVET